MLPFLEKKKLTSVLMHRLGKNPPVEVAMEQEAPGQESDGDLKMAAEDILRAIEHKSVLDLMHSLENFIYLCNSEPQESEE